MMRPAKSPKHSLATTFRTDEVRALLVLLEKTRMEVARSEPLRRLRNKFERMAEKAERCVEEASP
jgi:hypothetical protein